MIHIKDKIGNYKNMLLIDEIILNGIIENIKTDDENNYTIGVTDLVEKVTFRGKVVSESNHFPLSKEMEKRIGWKGYYANIRFVISDSPVEPTKIEETIIKTFYGEVDSFYTHVYSELTGYLWTNEGFKVGGHDIIAILKQHKGRYIHMEIEMYKARQ